MLKKFIYNGWSCDAEFFYGDNGCVIRFLDSSEEKYGNQLSDLVIAHTGYGFLHIKYVGEDAVLSGMLDGSRFSKDMIQSVTDFAEENISECRNVYLPYHIDFISMTDYDEYNGEY